MRWFAASCVVWFASALAHGQPGALGFTPIEERFPRRAWFVGLNASCAASGDVDGDGDADLIVGIGPDGALSLLRNDGTGGFPTSTPISATLDSLLVNLLDLDGDSDLDLAVIGLDASSTPRLRALSNGGSGQFQIVTDLALPFIPNSMSLADVDADGIVDCIATNDSPSGILPVWGQPGLQFAIGAQLPSGTVPKSVAIADFNGDLLPDLANTELNGIGIRFNQGGRVFTSKQLISLSGSLVRVGSMDFDFDGDQDLVTVSSTRVSLLKNAGDGTFQTPAFIPVPSPSNMHIRDMDGDGKSDIILAHGSTYGCSVLRSDGVGTFFPPVHALALASYSQIADFTGDGYLDFAGFATSSGITRSSWAAIIRGLPEGRLETATELPSTYAADILRLADLNGDGLQDIVAVDSGEDAIAIIRTDGAGGYLPPLAIEHVGDDPRNIAFGDIDGDGDTDVAITSLLYELAVFRNQGDGSFGAAEIYPVTTRAMALAIGDVDGDGDADCLAGSGATLHTFPNLGGGAFGAATSQSVGTTMGKCTLADLDADGDQDLVAEATFGVRLLGNKGSGVFTNIVAPLVNNNRGPVVADLDHDGIAEVIGVGPSGRLAVCRYRVTSSSYSTIEVAAPLSITWADVADVDADGVREIVAGGSSRLFCVFRVDGTIPLLPAVVFASGEGNASARFGRLDSDGDDDIVVSLPSRGALGVITNARLFSPRPLCPADIDGSLDVSVADFSILASHFGEAVTPNTLGDLNGDGLVNIADFTIFAAAFGRTCP